MKTSTAIVRGFEIWYQSRVSIVSAAALMAAAASRILTGGIDRRAVLLVLLGTALAYWSDDYLDHRRDSARSSAWRVPGMRIAKFIAACAAAIALVALIHFSRPAVALLFLVCSLLTAVFFLASLRKKARASPRWFAFRTTYIALVWSLVSVLTPVLDEDMPIRFRTIAATGFVCILMLSVCAMWNEGEHPERFLNLPPSYDSMLLFSCAVAALLVLLGIAAGWFPWPNVALLAACGNNALFVFFRKRFHQVDRRVLSEILIVLNLLCCLFVIGAYAHPFGKFGPQDLRDWFQLAAFAFFFGNIFLKSATLKTRDDNGDSIDLLLLLGLAILGFQMVVAALHLEGWLFPPLHRRLFAFDAAFGVGGLLAVAAILLQSAAYLSMSKSWRLMATSHEPTELVTTGPFAFTRNPVYVSAELYIAGAFLMNSTVVFAIFLLLAPAVIHLQIRREEHFLLEGHPLQYEAYCSHTPRYVIF
jgi:protein-S-isoprenylcysteine O-methyltransferase Ste14